MLNEIEETLSRITSTKTEEQVIELESKYEIPLLEKVFEQKKRVSWLKDGADLDQLEFLYKSYLEKGEFPPASSFTYNYSMGRTVYDLCDFFAFQISVKDDEDEYYKWVSFMLNASVGIVYA